MNDKPYINAIVRPPLVAERKMEDATRTVGGEPEGRIEPEGGTEGGFIKGLTLSKELTLSLFFKHKFL